MRRTNNNGTGFAFIVAVGLLGIIGIGSSANADRQDNSPNDTKIDKLTVIGLTEDGRLVRFRADSPRKARDIGVVVGLSGSDSSLVGMDYRVQDGKLYGVGNGGGVYTIDPATANAQLVNTLTVPLRGAVFGVDFNPAADRLRIISDTGQNLAHNVTGGVTVENASLTYTAPPAAPVPATGVTGAAYTNNDVAPAGAPTATTLFDVDTTLDQIVIQSPPGNGILVATGKLGFDAGPSAGLDIYSHVANGVTVANSAFATLSVNGRYSFYRVSLTTGRATLIGEFDNQVFDIALPLDQKDVPALR